MADATAVAACDQVYGKLASCPYCQNDLYGQCTDFCWHWANAGGVQLPGEMGDGGDWAHYAQGQQWTVSSTPQVGTLLCYSKALPDSDGDGHICVVTAVNGQEVTVEEANWKYPADKSPGKADCRSDGPGAGQDFSKYWLGFITIPGITPSGGSNQSGQNLDLSGITTALTGLGLELQVAAQNAENQAISAGQIAAGGLIMGAGGWLLMSGTRAPAYAQSRVQRTYRDLRKPSPAETLPTHLTAEERQWLTPMTQGRLAEHHPNATADDRANTSLLIRGRGTPGTVSSRQLASRSRAVTQRELTARRNVRESEARSARRAVRS